MFPYIHRQGSQGAGFSTIHSSKLYKHHLSTTSLKQDKDNMTDMNSCIANVLKGFVELSFHIMLDKHITLK